MADKAFRQNNTYFNPGTYQNNAYYNPGTHLISFAEARPEAARGRAGRHLGHGDRDVGAGAALDVEAVAALVTGLKANNHRGHLLTSQRAVNLEPGRCIVRKEAKRCLGMTERQLPTSGW